ncbi:MAG: PDZ domain-containing protein [Candidatus Nanopelagicales bacterium]
MTPARRLTAWRGAALFFSVVMALVVAFVPLPYLELSPGPTYNTIGEIDGTPLIKISGTTTYPTSGHLDLTTVSERGAPDSGVLTMRLLTGWADPDTKVLPREVFYPDDLGDVDIEGENARAFSDSTALAIAAALNHLDEPVREVTIVASVITGSPSDGKLEPGDEIVSVDGRKVAKPDDVTAAMSGVTPGDTVEVVVKRGPDKETVKASIVTTTNPEIPSRAFLGISIGITYEALFDIDVTLETVGGPSAGLMLSLGIVDLLTPGSLVDGRFVAGTGTITPDGTVGPIGGIAQKLAGARDSGATLFLVPAENCAEAVESGVPAGLSIAKVATLDDAVAEIDAYREGKPLTPCTP